MCSDLARRPGLAGGALTALCLLVLWAGASGCGRKGPPAPPIRYIPATTDDLTVAQQGIELVLELAYPSKTTGGQALPPLERLEIWQATRPAPEGRAPAPMEPQELAAVSRLLAALEGEELANAVSGGRIVVRLPAVELPAEPLARYYAVRTATGERDVTELSNQAVIVPTSPPAPPEELAVAPEAEGIRVSWSPPSEAEPPVAGFNLYRRDPRSRDWGRPLHRAGPEETSYLDTSTRYGSSYVYGVTTVIGREPTIESAPGGAREVDYRDRFAPPPPEGLVALVEGGRVRLVWRASAAADLAGYHVYREAPGETARRLTDEPVTGLEYVDLEPLPGEAIYRVTAIDALDNESAPGRDVRARPEP